MVEFLGCKCSFFAYILFNILVYLGYTPFLINKYCYLSIILYIHITLLNLPAVTVHMTNVKELKCAAVKKRVTESRRIRKRNECIVREKEKDAPKIKWKINLILFECPQFVVHYQWSNWSDVTSLGTKYLEVEGEGKLGRVQVVE